MIRRMCVLASAVLATAGVSSAQQVEIPVDDSLSSVEVTLNVAGGTDVDTSPLIGSILIDVEDFDTPAQFVVLDLSLSATDSIDHNIDFGILGSFTQSSSDLTVDYATPGTPSIPAVLAGENFTISSLEAVLGGSGNYNATGLVCSVLQGQMLPCSGVVELAGSDPITAQGISGELAIANGMISISLTIELDIPADPADPDAGGLNVVGVVTGSAPLPVSACTGDCDDSGSIDFNDLVSMLFEFGGDGGGVGCDADESGTVDFNDLVATLFLFGACP